MAFFSTRNCNVILFVSCLLLIAMLWQASCKERHYEPLIQSFKAFQSGNTLFSKLGGIVTVQAAVDAAADKLTSDSVLQPFFQVVGTEGHDSGDQLKASLDLMFTALLGGPACYTGMGNSITSTGRTFTRSVNFLARSMRESHKGLKVTKEVFDRFVSVLAGSLVDSGLTQDQVNRLAPKLNAMASNIITVA